MVCLAGKRWNRGGTYQMTARPIRDVLHQQVGSQLHVQLKGLWTLARRLRRITLIVVLAGAGVGHCSTRTSRSGGWVRLAPE